MFYILLDRSVLWQLCENFSSVAFTKTFLLDSDYNSTLMLKARFHYELGAGYFCFLLISLFREALKREKKEKKSLKQVKNALFHARSGNELLCIYRSLLGKLRVIMPEGCTFCRCTLLPDKVIANQLTKQRCAKCKAGQL